MKIYLVEDTGNCPGRIYAVMASRGDAETLADAISKDKTTCTVVERTLWYGQPPRGGFNE